MDPKDIPDAFLEDKRVPPLWDWVTLSRWTRTGDLVLPWRTFQMVAHSIIDQCLFEQAAQWAWGNVMKCQHDMSSYEGRIISSAEPLDPSVCLLQSKNTAWIDLIHQEFVKPRSDKLTLTRHHNWSNIEDHGWKFLQNLQKQAEVWQTAGNISFFQYWYHAQGTYSEIVIRRGKSIRGMESALRCRSVTPYRSCTRITKRNENTENRKKFMRRLGVTKWRNDGKKEKEKNIVKKVHFRYNFQSKIETTYYV